MNTTLLSPPKSAKNRTRNEQSNRQSFNGSVETGSVGQYPSRLSAKHLSGNKLYKHQRDMHERLSHKSGSPLATRSYYTNKWCTVIYKDESRRNQCCCCPRHDVCRFGATSEVSEFSAIKEKSPKKSTSPKKKSPIKKKLGNYLQRRLGETVTVYV